MFRTKQTVLLLSMLLLVMATSTVRCTCNPSKDECLTAEQCIGSYDWRSDECTEQEGHWECIARRCVSVCPECNEAADCSGNAWDGPCAEIDGHWECLDQVCVAACDEAECLVAGDCSDELWPTDAGCVEADGHWECNAQVCEAVCDAPECSQASDCEALDWPSDLACVAADGHWECNGGSCDAICDDVGCSQPADCESLAWPADALDCVAADGFWTCEAGDCVANCDGDECLSPADCDAMAWTGENDCGGFWSCENGYCFAVCDETGCGDANCDAAGGETPVSCPDDCVECSLTADCLGGDWDLACAGHWSCEANACVQVCDYDHCGDDDCDATLGEDDQSCRPDCGGGTCHLPTDCLGESWTEICQGSWTCNFMGGGLCQANCTAPLCGNGVCQPELGEADHCPDCSDQLCSSDADCDSLDLPIGCSGYWTCAWVVCLPICE